MSFLEKWYRCTSFALQNSTTDMHNKTLALSLLCWLTFGTPMQAQYGFALPPGVQQLEVPFEYVNNFIIITVGFNGRLPLKFIYDTGAEHTILSKREISDLLQVRYDREFRVKGSDLRTELVAYLARNIRFEILNREIVAPSEDILVLKEDYLRFEEYAGVEAHGILAGRVFARYLVKINYQRKVITLYERGSIRMEREGFMPVPIEMFRNKPYLVTQAQIRPDSAAPVKLLLDTGAGMSLMLFSNTHPLIQPSPNAIPTNIGMGLGGYLEGFVGRISGLGLGPFSQKNILTYFQQMDTTLDISQLNDRNGLIGNTILDRYLLVFDFQESVLWLKPTKRNQADYVYDRSGMNLIASGVGLHDFSVLNVLPGSPADEAGIHAGDRVLRIGWLTSNMRSLGEMQAMLQGKPGKKLTVVIQRDGKVMKKRIVLRDLI